MGRGRARREVLDARAAKAAGCLRQFGVSPYRGWELLERAWLEVAHVVDLAALEQLRDAVTVSRARRDVQEQVAVSERLVVDLQGRSVVTEPLEGLHDAPA